MQGDADLGVSKLNVLKHFQHVTAACFVRTLLLFEGMLYTFA